jgi:hypothetical protein
MRDGAIMSDEQSAIGELPEMIRRRSFFVRRKTMADDVAGVSALMKAVPDTPSKRPAVKKSAKKPATRKKTYTAKKPVAKKIKKVAKS